MTLLGMRPAPRSVTEKTFGVMQSGRMTVRTPLDQVLLPSGRSSAGDILSILFHIREHTFFKMFGNHVNYYIQNLWYTDKVIQVDAHDTDP